jgi:hypothetical protein
MASSVSARDQTTRPAPNTALTRLKIRAMARATPTANPGPSSSGPLLRQMTPVAATAAKATALSSTNQEM